MLYVLHGTDTTKSREKVNALIRTLLSKKPDALLVRITGETFTEETLEEYISSLGLFEQKSIVVLDTVFESKENQSAVLAKLKEIESSDNIFILLEGKIDAKTLTRISKHATKSQEHMVPKKVAQKPDFNIFELSDALGERNRKKLWVIHQEGKLRNISDEEMHGILFWGVKNMILARNENDAKSAGLSPFVYGKAKRYASNFTKKELDQVSSKLVSLYHESRRGIISFDTALEQAILQMV